ARAGGQVKHTDEIPVRCPSRSRGAAGNGLVPGAESARTAPKNPLWRKEFQADSRGATACTRCSGTLRVGGAAQSPRRGRWRVAPFRLVSYLNHMGSSLGANQSL